MTIGDPLKQTTDHSSPFTMARVDIPLSKETLDTISLVAFLALFPVSYCMYRHFLSMRRRYPSDPGAQIGIGGVKSKVG
mgnify:CR=1 FL=1